MFAREKRQISLKRMEFSWFFDGNLLRKNEKNDFSDGYSKILGKFRSFRSPRNKNPMLFSRDLNFSSKIEESSL